MKQNKLGKTGIAVSELSLGCMSLKSNHPRQTRDIVQRAYENGINFFDTADLYDKGNNEVVVGEAVQSFRKNIVLSTKVGNQWRDDGSGWDWKASKPYILKTVESSLVRLKTDYIDLYQLHGGTIEDPIDEIIEAFEQLKQQGKIRAYGISSIRPNVIRAFVDKSDIASVMMQYSLLDRRPEEELISLLHAHDISILARGPVAKGILIDKPVEPYLQYTSGEVAHIVRQVDSFAQKYHLSKQSVALSFVLSSPVIATAVCGISSPLQLDELIRIQMDIVALNEEQRAELLNGVRSICYVEHR